MAGNIAFEVPPRDLWRGNSVCILVRDKYGNENQALVTLPPGTQPGSRCAVAWRGFSAAELLDGRRRCTPIKAPPPPQAAPIHPPGARLSKKRRIARVEALLGAADETTAFALSAHRLAVATTTTRADCDDDEHRSPSSMDTRSGDPNACYPRSAEDEPLYLDSVAAPTDEDDAASGRDDAAGRPAGRGRVRAFILERALLRPMEGQMLRLANADRAHALRAGLLCVERTRQSCGLALLPAAAAGSDEAASLSAAALGAVAGDLYGAVHTRATRNAADAQLLLEALNYDSRAAPPPAAGDVSERLIGRPADDGASPAEQRLDECSYVLEHERALLTRELGALGGEGVARVEQPSAWRQPTRPHHADVVRQAAHLRRLLARPE